VGQTIKTLTGRPNTVIEIVGDQVIVGTTRSPRGKPVPLAEVDAAIERLYADGEVAINPQSVGYRSAFVGAVLATLSEAIVPSGQQRVVLRRSPAE
jgi:hypothetical protein